MKKPLSPTQIVALTEEGILGLRETSGNHANAIENSSERARLHLRFNPSQVGFGIVAAAKDIQHPAAAIDEDITCEIAIEEGQ